MEYCSVLKSLFAKMAHLPFAVPVLCMILDSMLNCDYEVKQLIVRLNCRVITPISDELTILEDRV